MSSVRTMVATDLVGRLSEACQGILARCPIQPAIGLVLGSGLGALADTLESPLSITYAEIPHMPAPTVSGHAGQLRLGTIDQHPVACLQGRVHLYEGHPPERVVFGVRLLARLGCRAVLLTNAAGAVRPSFRPGTLMAITDHINLMGANPLAGKNEEALGPRFPDMTRAYDLGLLAALREAAAETGVDLPTGVYAGLLGPSYETPAEIAMLRVLGADAVGMSTVPEVIALRHMQVRVGAVSCITNMAAGLGDATLGHEEVEQTARAARDGFVALLRTAIPKIARLTTAEEHG